MKLFRWLLLALFGLFGILPAFAAENKIEETFLYYGKVVSIDYLIQVTSENVAATFSDGFVATFACVFVPGDNYNPFTDTTHVYNCFNTQAEAVAFANELIAKESTGTQEEVSNSGCGHWAYFRHSGYNTWLLDLCPGWQAFLGNEGAWSIWDASTRSTTLWNHPTNRGTWNYTTSVWSLGNTVGGARSARVD